MSVSASTAVNLLIGLAVLVLILVRQMQVRPVRANMRLPLILAVIGVIELTQFFQHNQPASSITTPPWSSLRWPAAWFWLR